MLPGRIAKAAPAHRRPVEPQRLLPRNQQKEVKRVGERQLTELTGRCLGSEKIAALDRALESSVWRASQSHEHMFADAQYE